MKVAVGVFWLCLIGLCGFQLALALGMPWGDLAMGGMDPGVYSTPMRISALVQIVIYLVLGLIVLIEGGLIRPKIKPYPKGLIWIVVVLMAIGTVLNMITPSEKERLLWTPVAAIMFICALRIALEADRK